MSWLTILSNLCLLKISTFVWHIDTDLYFKIYIKKKRFISIGNNSIFKVYKWLFESEQIFKININDKGIISIEASFSQTRRSPASRSRPEIYYAVQAHPHHR